MKETRQLWDLESLIELLDQSPSVSLFTADDRMELYRLANIYTAHCFDTQVFANAVSLYFERKARENASTLDFPPSSYQNASDEWNKLRKEADKMLLPADLTLGGNVIGCRPALEQEQYNEMMRKIQRYVPPDSIQMIELEDENVGAEELATHLLSVIDIIELFKRELLQSKHLLDTERTVYETNRYLHPLSVTSRQDEEEVSEKHTYSSCNNDAVLMKPVVDSSPRQQAELGASTSHISPPIPSCTGSPSPENALVTSSKSSFSRKSPNNVGPSQSKMASQRSKSIKEPLPVHVVEDVKEIFSYLPALHEYAWFLRNYSLFKRSKESICDIGIKDFFNEHADMLRQGCENAINAYTDFVVLYDKIGHENYLLSKHATQKPNMHRFRPFWQISRFAIARISFLLAASLASLAFSNAFPAASLIGDLLFYTGCYALIEKTLLYARVVWLEAKSSKNKAYKRSHGREFSKQLLYCQGRALGSRTDLAYLFFPIYVFAFMYAIGVAAPLSAFLAASLTARRLIPLVWVIFHSIQSLTTPSIASYDSVEKAISNLFVSKKPTLHSLSSPVNMINERKYSTLKQTIDLLAKENPLIAYYSQAIADNETAELAHKTSSRVLYLQSPMHKSQRKQPVRVGDATTCKAKQDIPDSTIKEETSAFAHQGLFAPKLRQKALKTPLKTDDITISESLLRYTFTMYADEISDALLLDMQSSKLH